MTLHFNPSEWITTREASTLTGYAVVHLRQLAQRGKIAALKKGRDWLLNKKDVLSYAETMEQLGADKHNPWRTGSRERETAED